MGQPRTVAATWLAFKEGRALPLSEMLVGDTQEVWAASHSTQQTGAGLDPEDSDAPLRLVGAEALGRAGIPLSIRGERETGLGPWTPTIRPQVKHYPVLPLYCAQCPMEPFKGP